jgi:hypothetical protein
LFTYLSIFFFEYLNTLFWFFFFAEQGLNSGLYTCLAVTLSFEPCIQQNPSISFCRSSLLVPLFWLHISNFMLRFFKKNWFDSHYFASLHVQLTWIEHSLFNHCWSWTFRIGGSCYVTSFSTELGLICLMAEVRREAAQSLLNWSATSFKVVGLRCDKSGHCWWSPAMMMPCSGVINTLPLLCAVLIHLFWIWSTDIELWLKKKKLSSFLPTFMFYQKLDNQINIFNFLTSNFHYFIIFLNKAY